MTGYAASFEAAMRLALAEATAAATAVASLGTARGGAEAAGARAGRAVADVPVGAVVLDAAGTVIASGHNRRETDADPTAHAEVVALRAAGRARGDWRLDGCTVVVTLEPCTMCAGAMLAGRIARLVYGTHDERAGAAGSVWDLLHDPRLGPPVEVVSGVLSAECAALLQGFFEQLR